MTTPRMQSRVSLAAALALTFALGACASAPSRAALDASALPEAPLLVVRFDNDARDYVHVYLVGERREWLLGRVESGARATLRIPELAVANDARSVQLAVLVGGHVSARAARDPRATITMAQPTAAFQVQRWTFSQALASGQLTALPLGRTAVRQ